MRGDRAVDDAPEVGADLVGAALVGGVAGRALLEDRLAGLRVGLGQQRPDRLLRRRFAAAPPPAGSSAATIA